MIQRLMSEQTDEDNHKNWCDEELHHSNVSKSDKTEKHAMLTAKIDADTATAEVRTQEIEANTQMLAALAQHVAEATEIRQTGKSENKQAVKDSQDAQTALANAVAVLRHTTRRRVWSRRRLGSSSRTPQNSPRPPRRGTPNILAS